MRRKHTYKTFKNPKGWGFTIYFGEEPIRDTMFLYKTETAAENVARTDCATYDRARRALKPIEELEQEDKEVSAEDIPDPIIINCEQI